jgi:hypothetical protein
MTRSRKLRTPVPSRSATVGTPSTVVSPVFSTKSSAQPTPDTSDIDEDASKPMGRPKRTTRSSASTTIKRPAESDGDSDNDAEGISALPKKRRVVTRSAYVEIPVRKGVRSNGQTKVIAG